MVLMVALCYNVINEEKSIGIKILNIFSVDHMRAMVDIEAFVDVAIKATVDFLEDVLLPLLADIDVV